MLIHPLKRLQEEVGEHESMVQLADKLRFDRSGVIVDLVMISCDVFVNDYVMSESKMHFTDSLRSYGLTPLESSKLYVYLMNLESAEKGKAASRPKPSEPVQAFGTPEEREREDFLEVSNV